jgi:hypothetical protein
MLSGRWLYALGAVALLAAAIAVAGCGGGDSTTTASIGKAEFIKKAEAICERGQQKLHSGYEALINEKAHRSTLEEEEEWVERVIAPNLTQEVSEIRALGMPKGDEARVEGLLEAVEDGLRELQENPQSVLASSAEKFNKAIQLENSYGLQVCVQNY